MFEGTYFEELRASCSPLLASMTLSDLLVLIWTFLTLIILINELFILIKELCINKFDLVVFRDYD